MKNGEIAKQMVNLHKSSFDSSFSAMVMFQDQMESLLKNFINQSPGINDEGKKIIDQWISIYKKGRDDFKKAVNNEYAKTESFLECSEIKIFDDQSDNILNAFLNPKSWTPYDFKSYIEKTTDTYKNVYDEFKKQTERTENFLPNAQKQAQTKTKQV
ncbi:MAG: hypothetical protein WBN66_08645 [Smithella sp.]